MGDIQTRPFSKNYSGLVNQSVIAFAITVLCVSGQELMKRARRGKNPPPPELGLGSRESWGFGYLYQGRSWAKIASPPSPRGWILSWVPQVIWISQEEMHRLRGVDATLYIRWLRGCFYFTLLHTLTTFPILFPIHVEFSEGSGASPKSMTRASISSLVQDPEGLELLWIHICLLFWITLTWIATLFWIVHGAFMLRAADIDAAAKRKLNPSPDKRYYPHPHPQYPFAEVLPETNDEFVEGLRLRTVMVSNLLPQLKNERELKEYFEYFLSRRIDRPVLPGDAMNDRPGFINKSLAFLFNRAKRLPSHLPTSPLMSNERTGDKGDNLPRDKDVPIIERVVVTRRMTELASLLERREEILVELETAHLKLAKNTLLAVRDAMAAKQKGTWKVKEKKAEDAETGDMTEEERMDRLIEALGPFVEEFGLLDRAVAKRSEEALNKHVLRRLQRGRSQDSNDSDTEETPTYPPTTREGKRSMNKPTVWDALLSVPRSSLDPYQPLLRLSHLFRDKTVPSIDYYTAKLNLLSSLILENRSQPVNRYDPASTAFVTFANPEDAFKACTYLTVHPNNPLACTVQMAPPYQDLDWTRIMKSSFNTEFLKDWVVSLGVWGFTIFWLFPVSFLVGLVSIQSISTFWPSLKIYLDRHPWEEEVIQSFVPTLLVSLLALLIPMILLLIAKKAHTITTLSALHDRIMTRYYKFLIINVLIFFCVGTAALQSVLSSFGATPTPNVLQIVADSFPTAGPFYVGWIIFTTAMHGAFEIALLGLPLILYPKTRSQVTPRKRAVGTRPRTFNFYYWVPTHVLVINVLLLFAVLFPFVLPFGCFYFFIENGVVKNQLIHVYAKNYEGNGKLILIRLIRYSLDGLILTQAVFLAYMVVLKKEVNVGLSAVLIILTTAVKLFMTRMCRAQFDHDDIAEARIVCGQPNSAEEGDHYGSPGGEEEQDPDITALLKQSAPRASRLTWRVPEWVAFTWSSVKNRAQPHALYRRPNPFRTTPRHPFTPTTPFDATDTMKAEYNPSAINHKYDPLDDVTNKVSAEPSRMADNDVPAPVIPHEPLRPWDDQTTVDLPYDNPYYTRTISNALWLPRDPIGILNLDDTVDLRIAITVEAPNAPLGTWSGVDGDQQSPEALSQISSDTTLPESNVHQPDVDGTEDIDLPPAIARRVSSRSSSREVIDVVPPRRQASFRSRTSLRSHSPNVPYPALPSHFTTPASPRSPIKPPHNFRSVSDGRAHRPRPRATSLMSMFEPHVQRASTMGTAQEPGVRPDIHAQGEFVAGNPSASGGSLERPKVRARNISAHSAIVHEVMAEEEDALNERVQEEQAEAEKATTTKSWLVSWLFQRPSGNN